MASKMVTRRKENSRNLEAAAREHAGLVAGELRDRFGSELAEGAELPDVETLLNLLASRLGSRTSGLDLVDKDQKTRRQTNADARRRRNEAATAVRRELGAMRAALAGVYGQDAASRALGFEGKVRIRHEDLLAAATEVVAQLAAGPLKLPAARVEGAQLDSSTWLDKLAQPTAELAAAVDELSGTKRKAEHPLTRKHSGLVEFDLLYSRTAGLVKALLLYAGLDGLAERLRPAANKTLAEPAPAPTPGGPVPTPTTP